MLWMLWWVALTTLSCNPAPESGGAERAKERERMVAEQIAARGVKDAGTLAAMRQAPRHEFVPTALASEAYNDHPLPGHFARSSR